MRLITIPLSHYCERARWALDRAGVAYVEEQHLQVFSGRRTKALGARRFVPALIGDGLLLKDSADILRYADEHAPPDRRVYPEDPVLRTEILAFEKPLAESFGVEARRLAYDALLPFPSLLLKYNAGKAPLHERAIVRLGFRWMERKIRDHLSIRPPTVATARDAVARALDTVAERLAGRTYLFGDAFSAADLTFAALGAILVWPAGYGTPVPGLDELPDAVRADVQAWRAHPAGRHILRMYELHRR
jgi:glutathione S-transferase